VIAFRALARRELAAQLMFLAARSPEAAVRLTGEVQSALQRLDAGVLEGAPLRLRSGRQVRRWLVSPLLVFYVRREARCYRAARAPRSAAPDREPLTS